MPDRDIAMPRERRDARSGGPAGKTEHHGSRGRTAAPCLAGHRASRRAAVWSRSDRAAGTTSARPRLAGVDRDTDAHTASKKKPIRRARMGKLPPGKTRFRTLVTFPLVSAPPIPNRRGPGCTGGMAAARAGNVGAPPCVDLSLPGLDARASAAVLLSWAAGPPGVAGRAFHSRQTRRASGGKDYGIGTYR